MIRNRTLPPKSVRPAPSLLSGLTRMKRPLEVGVEQDIGASTRRRILEDACQAQAIQTAGGLELNLVVVADGIDEANLGERATRLTVETIFAHCRRSTGSNIPHILREGIERANAAVYSEGRGQRSKRGLGSTATVVALHKGRLYLAHVGNSRAYLVRGKKVMQLTQDHTWAQAVVRAGKLNLTDATRNPRAAKLVRFIGYGPRIEVDLGLRLRGAESDQEALGNQGLALKPGDSVVVCSDGLIKSKAAGRGHYVEPEEIASTVESNSAMKAARTLLSLALQRNVDDNVSVVVLKIPLSRGMEIAQWVRGKPWAVSGLGMLLTAPLLVFGLSLWSSNQPLVTPTPPALPPNAAYVQFIRGEGRATYLTNRMTRPENLAQGAFVDSGIGSIVRTHDETAIKLFLTQVIVVWLGPNSELEIRELTSAPAGKTATEIKLIKGSLLTIVTSQLPPGETFRVIGDPGHLAQVTGSVMGVRYTNNFQTFDVDCLEGHCLADGASLTDCEWIHSESDLVPSPVGFANQSWYAFVEKNEKLTTHCIPTATPTNAPSPTATYPPKPTVAVSPTEPPSTSTPVVNVTSPPPNPTEPGPSTPIKTPIPTSATSVLPTVALTPVATSVVPTLVIPASPVPSNTPALPVPSNTFAPPSNTPIPPPPPDTATPKPTKCQPRWKCP